MFNMRVSRKELNSIEDYLDAIEEVESEGLPSWAYSLSETISMTTKVSNWNSKIFKLRKSSKGGEADKKWNCVG